jgi:hypothetical protein
MNLDLKKISMTDKNNISTTQQAILGTSAQPGNGNHLTGTGGVQQDSGYSVVTPKDTDIHPQLVTTGTNNTPVATATVNAANPNAQPEVTPPPVTTPTNTSVVTPHDTDIHPQLIQQAPAEDNTHMHLLPNGYYSKVVAPKLAEQDKKGVKRNPVLLNTGPYKNDDGTTTGEQPANTSEPAVNKAQPAPEKPSSPKETPQSTGYDPEVEDAIAKKKDLTFQQMMDLLDRKGKSMGQDETPEQKKKREKYERWQKIFAALGDGVSSLANLHYTSKGAPNGYDPKTSLSSRLQAILDKEQANRKSNSNARLEYALKKLNLQNDKYNSDLAAEKQKNDTDLAYRKDAREAKDSDFKDKLITSQVGVNDANALETNAKAKITEIDAKYEGTEKQLDEQLKKAKTATEKQRVKTLKAQAYKAYKEGRATLIRAVHSGNKGGKNGSGGDKNKYHLTLGGKTYSFTSKDDMATAVVREARKHKIKIQYPVKDEYNNKVYKNRTIPGIAAELEQKYGAAPQPKGKSWGAGHSF